MITGAEALLRKNPEVRQAVLDEIDCVIIDEFQDTNPVQFALCGNWVRMYRAHCLWATLNSRSWGFRSRSATVAGVSKIQSCIDTAP